MPFTIANPPVFFLFQASRNYSPPRRRRRRRLLLSSSSSSPVHLHSACPWLNDRRVVDYFHGSLLCYSSSSSSSNAFGCEDEWQKQATAIEAVSDILRENGVSLEEAMEIAVKSPKYVEMLMDSVGDLDELFPPIPSCSSSSSSSSCSCYKKRVLEMGKQKGDKGLVPILESMVGLPLPSAMHIARYLSSAHTPPTFLLHKVKYLKQLLFSHVDDGKVVPIAKTARRMMMHLSLSIDDDLQHTLSFLEKIQARRGGLGLLGSGDGSFRYLVESFPRLLLLSVESNMKPVVDFLECIGVPKACIRNVFLLYPPILFYDIEKDIKPTSQLFTKVYGEDTEFGKMLLKYPWILSTSIQKNYEEIIAFLHAEKRK